MHKTVLDVLHLPVNTNAGMVVTDDADNILTGCDFDINVDAKEDNKEMEQVAMKSTGHLAKTGTHQVTLTKNNCGRFIRKWSL